MYSHEKNWAPFGHSDLLCVEVLKWIDLVTDHVPRVRFKIQTIKETINPNNSHKSLWCSICSACLEKIRSEIVMLQSVSLFLLLLRFLLWKGIPHKCSALDLFATKATSSPWVVAVLRNCPWSQDRIACHLCFWARHWIPYSSVRTVL